VRTQTSACPRASVDTASADRPVLSLFPSLMEERSQEL
jgi:hypothetical protein